MVVECRALVAPTNVRWILNFGQLSKWLFVTVVGVRLCKGPNTQHVVGIGCFEKGPNTKQYQYKMGGEQVIWQSNR